MNSKDLKILICAFFAVIVLLGIAGYSAQLSRGEIGLDEYVGKVFMQLMPPIVTFIVTFGALGLFAYIILKKLDLI